MNNPVNSNDPTGHRPCGDDEAVNCEGRLNNPKPKKPGGGCGGIGQKRCDGSKPTYGDGLIGPPNTVTLSRTETYLNTTPPDSFWSGFQSIWDGGNLLNNAFDFVMSLDKATTLLEKGFLWGKAVNPNPVLDFVLGAAGQTISDLDRGNLTLGQRAGRSLVVGAESIGTGIVSDIGGGIGFLAGEAIVAEGGGIPGLAIGLVGTSLWMDEKVWKGYNQSHFDSWGLGYY